MPSKAFTAALAACLFLLIVGAKWAVFDRFGSPMPDWDQWDAEAVELFIPWFEKDNFLAHLFHPHNEHRVILTKLQNLALGLVNGQWDSRVEAASNALLHAVLGVAFWCCARRWVIAAAGEPTSCAPARSAAFLNAALFGLIAILFGLPVAWQNVLGGFHSQQYWLLGLAFVTIAVLPFERPWSGPWWAALFATVLALGSMGSGFIAAAVVCVVMSWQLVRRDSSWRASWPTLAIALGVVALGLLTRVEVEWHQKLKATTVRDFFVSIVHSLQWPLRDRDWAALVLWLPWLVLAWRVLPRRPSLRPSAVTGGAIILALGGWVLVQVAATAYARGVGADYPASRYMDTLAFGAVANAAALAWLIASAMTRRASRALGVVGLAWLLTLGLGLNKLLSDVLLIELPDARKYYNKAEGNMRRYLGTNDPKHLAGPDIPFPDGNALVERLGKPSLRALMPVPIRAPLPVTPAATAAGFFENDARGSDPEKPPRAGLSPQTPPLDYTKTWGSFGASADGGTNRGEWRSAPLKATLRGYLKFETAGQIRNPNGGVTFELRDAESDALITTVRPDRIPDDSWRAGYVRAPRRPFVLVARDEHAARWMAFSGPTEMGFVSYWTWRLTKHGLLIALCAAAATIVLAGLGAWRWLKPKSPAAA